MANGFRVQPVSKKEKMKELETYVANLSTSSKITQNMVQQLLVNHRNMASDLNKALNMLNETQYKVLALQRLADVSLEQVASTVDEIRLNDFNEASDKEDTEKQYSVGSVVKEDSIVILTSKTDTTPDRGIFSSKIKLSESGVPDLITALMDREVGARAIVKLNGEDHTIELLGIRQPPAALEESSH